MAKILLVEDEDDFAVLIRDLLEHDRHEVKRARNGKEGLECLASYRPDLILLDWQMPVLDGEGFCRELRRMPERRMIPVIVLTVKKGEPNELEALHFGADDFVNKPFEPEELSARIRAALRRAAAGGARR